MSNIGNPDFKKLIKRMEVLSKAEEIDKEAFDQIVDDVYTATNILSGVDNQNIHLIDNLCLVDSRTNSQLNNSVFDVKREIIKKRELAGFYIPICTRNAFLKAYTEYSAGNAYWTEEDRSGYLKNIKDTYDYFVNTIKPNRN